MKITTKRMTATKTALINLINTICFTNHQKWQLLDFLKKYPCKKITLNVNFKSLHSNNKKC